MAAGVSAVELWAKYKGQRSHLMFDHLVINAFKQKHPAQDLSRLLISRLSMGLPLMPHRMSK